MCFSLSLSPPPTLCVCLKMCDEFKDLQFFMGESCNTDAMTVIMLYKGETPYLYFFKDGLIEEKVVSLTLRINLQYQSFIKNI